MNFLKTFYGAALSPLTSAKARGTFDGKGVSVADVARFKPEVDKKDYVAQWHTSPADIEAALKTEDEVYYPKRLRH